MPRSTNPLQETDDIETTENPLPEDQTVTDQLDTVMQQTASPDPAEPEPFLEPVTETATEQPAGNAPEGPKSRKHRAGAIVLDVILAVIAVLVVFIIVFAVCFKGVYIIGNSMQPTLTGAIDSDTEGGDYVYCNKYRKPTYGDVVIIQETEEKVIIKRVIAMAGDTVKMDEGTVYIQYAGTAEYTALTEDYVAAENCTPTLKVNNQEAHTVADGCIYCLGDNRDISNDSRQNGDFTLDSVLGVVPGWAISIKGFTTSMYNLVHF